MSQREILFGTTRLYRVKCPVCKRQCFLDKDGLTTCCNAKAILDGEIKVERRSEAYWRRKKPGKSKQKQILEEQEYKCIYCGADLECEAELNFDHFVPWTWSANNHHTNFVASCKLCNMLKSDKLFSSVNEVRKYVKKRFSSRDGKFIDQDT